MKKIHTRQKRVNRSPPGLRSIRGASRKRAIRPRTFKSEKAAKAWAEKQGIKKYELVNIKGFWRQDKKIKVVPSK